MAFLGKEYKFVGEENFNDFVESWGLSEEQTKPYKNYKPTQKLTLNGDTYTFTAVVPGDSRTVSFKSGVEFEDKSGGFTSKATITVEGNVMTEVKKFEDGKVFTYKREYNGDDLVVTITSNSWDGVAKRFYKA